MKRKIKRITKSMFSRSENTKKQTIFLLMVTALIFGISGCGTYQLRDDWQEPDLVIKELGLKEGMCLADIGALFGIVGSCSMDAARLERELKKAGFKLYKSPEFLSRKCFRLLRQNFQVYIVDNPV